MIKWHNNTEPYDDMFEFQNGTMELQNGIMELQNGIFALQNGMSPTPHAAMLLLLI